MLSFSHLILADGVPIYQQILRYVKLGIAGGTIAHGEELPSRRVVSALLGVNPNTVQKAYRLLEEEGLILSHTPGRGPGYHRRHETHGPVPAGGPCPGGSALEGGRDPMRPHRALFHLVLRHTVWKVLLLLLLLAAAQWSAFLCLSPDPASIGLADAFSLSGGALAGLLALAFLLLSALLLLATTGRGARRPGYTLARLPLSPGWVVFWQGVYNTLVYLLFWGVQALVLVGIGWYYGRQGGFLGTQTLYVTVWELDLLHFVRPLDLPGRWVSNAALAAGLGFTAALFTEGLHRGRKNFTFFVLAACCFLFLPGGRPQMIAGAAALCLLVGLLLRRKRKETADETLETM